MSAILNSSTDALSLRRRVAEEISPAIRWMTPESGVTKCPAEHDCRIYIDDDPVPTFFCFHESCQSELMEWNAQLRSRCPASGRIGKSKERLEQEKLYRRLWEVDARTRRYVLPVLLRQPETDTESLPATSPYPLPQAIRNDWCLLLSGLFKPDDIIWCGELYETGSPEHSRNFQTVSSWVKQVHPPGPQTCPAIFKPIRPTSRTKENVQSRPYIIIESDTIPKAQFVNVVRHVEKLLKLRAIVDTGNKSIHCWFDCVKWNVKEPVMSTAFKAFLEDYSLIDREPECWKILFNQDNYREAKIKKLHSQWYFQREELYAILRGLGCDGHLLNLTSTTRLPGCRRINDKGEPLGWQKLLYLNPVHPPIEQSHRLYLYE